MHCVAAGQDRRPPDAVEEVLQAHGAVVLHAVGHAHVILLSRSKHQEGGALQQCTYSQSTHEPPYSNTCKRQHVVQNGMQLGRKERGPAASSHGRVTGQAQFVSKKLLSG